MSVLNAAYEAERKRKRQVEEAKFNMYMQKKRVVQTVQEQNRQDFRRKENYIKDDQIAKIQQRETIREMATKAKENVTQFRQKKVMTTKYELKAKTETEKRLIYKYEREAQLLEEQEEKLIKRLQDIQDEEKDAFSELEQAMITASLAKRDRLEIVAEEAEENYAQVI